MHGSCLVASCERPARSRGWCNRHYENWRRYGDPVPQRDKPLAEKLRQIGWDETPSGCWEWRGRRNWFGYGMFDQTRVHRLMHELATGETPTVVRHTCDNPPCVNPAHLLSGEPSDNVQDMVERRRHWKHDRTECPNGHDLTVDESTRTVRNHGRETTICVRCARNRQAAYDARRRSPAMQLAPAGIGWPTDVQLPAELTVTDAPLG